MTEEDEMQGLQIFDAEDGVDLVIPVAGGVSVTIALSREGAESLVRIVQNKLDGQWE